MNRWQRVGLGWLLMDIIILLLVNMAPPESRPDWLFWMIAGICVVGVYLFVFAGKDE